MTCYQKLDVKLSALDQFSYFVVNYTALHEVHELPGIYLWQAIPRDEEDLKHIIYFFQQAKLKAHVSGTLRLSYSGELVKQIYGGFDLERIPQDLFRNIMMAVAYPIYIGISKNLQTRLNNHKKNIEDISGRELVQKGRDSFIEEEVDVDSPEESRNFAARLLKLWNANISFDRLFVAYVVPEKCLKCSVSNKCNNECISEVVDSLRCCETLFNSIYNPMFGRR